MNCSKCGAPLREKADCCPVCGRKVSLNSTNRNRERQVIDKTPSGRGLKVAVIIVSSVLALCLLFIGLCIFGPLGESVFSPKSICMECGTQFRGDGEYCEECEILIKNTKECKMCQGKHTTDAKLCEDCLGEIDEAFYAGKYFCFVCEQVLEKNDITYIDSFGFVLCGDCDEDYECDDCGRKFKYTEISYDNGKLIYCNSCYEDIFIAACGSCNKDIIDSDEYKKREDQYYCIDCFKNLTIGVCKECGKELKPEDDYYGEKGDYCCDGCYVGICKVCDGIISGSKYKKVDGRYYCYECYGGKGYLGDCYICGDKVNSKQDYIEKNGNLYCDECGEE